jgi:glycosyltransferase involved in cell wall biosynthesis
MSPLRIAMIGQRGVPATFGGIEHHVEELGARLVARGHEVTVFCRTNYVREPLQEYRGMRLCHLPTVGTKHLDAIAHSARSTYAAMREHYDIFHYHALGPGLLSVVPRFASRSKVVLTAHGLDYDRAKWGKGARSVLKFAAWMSARVPDVTIAVSRALADYYARRHDREAVYIPNGVPQMRSHPLSVLADGDGTREMGLERGRYLLFVGRLVPEKMPDLLIRAFRRLPGDLKLVFAGGTSFTNDYVDSLLRLAAADPRVVFTGYVYGAVLEALYSNAAAFVLPSDLEGLPLTLLEAAASGTPVVVSDIPPHLEVLVTNGPGRRLFPTGDLDGLTDALRVVLADQEAEREGAAVLRQHVLRCYRWDDAVDATEAVYHRLVRPPRRLYPVPSPSAHNGSSVEAVAAGQDGT